MERLSAYFLTASLIATSASAQDAPYAELDTRAIKALSTQQVDDYLAGRGMGLALAGELNGYPGPRHVLELAEPLGLDAAQAEAVQLVHDRMLEAARALGARIVSAERDLDAAFAAGGIDADLLTRSATAIGRMNGELRALHLAAHLETTALLRPEQVRAYQALRGYGDGSIGGHGPTEAHHGH